MNEQMNEKVLSEKYYVKVRMLQLNVLLNKTKQYWWN